MCLSQLAYVHSLVRWTYVRHIHYLPRACVLTQILMSIEDELCILWAIGSVIRRAFLFWYRVHNSAQPLIIKYIFLPGLDSSCSWDREIDVDTLELSSDELSKTGSGDSSESGSTDDSCDSACDSENADDSSSNTEEADRQSKTPPVSENESLWISNRRQLCNGTTINYQSGKKWQIIELHTWRSTIGISPIYSAGGNASNPGQGWRRQRSKHARSSCQGLQDILY